MLPGFLQDVHDDGDGGEGGQGDVINDVAEVLLHFSFLLSRRAVDDSGSQYVHDDGDGGEGGQGDIVDNDPGYVLFHFSHLPYAAPVFLGFPVWVRGSAGLRIAVAEP